MRGRKKLIRPNEYSGRPLVYPGMMMNMDTEIDTDVDGGAWACLGGELDSLESALILGTLSDALKMIFSPTPILVIGSDGGLGSEEESNSYLTALIPPPFDAEDVEVVRSTTIVQSACRSEILTYRPEAA